MGLFPIDASDGDEVTNANGTTFKYVAVDDKWIIVCNLLISDIAYNATSWDNNKDAATKNVIRDQFEGHTHIESDITDLDHDAHKILTKVFTEGGGALTNSDIMVYRTSTGKWELEPKPAAGSTPSLDEVFDIGKVIDGATTEANAMQVGDGSEKFKIFQNDHYSQLKSSGYGRMDENSIVYMKLGCTLAQLQDAIDTLSTAGGGIVQLPRGTINIGTTSINMKSNVWLRGVGYDATIIQYTGTGGAFVCDAVIYIRISDLKVWNDVGGHGIRILNICNNIHIHHCWFKSDIVSSGVSIYLEYNHTINDVYIYKNHFENYQYGIVLYCGARIFVINNYFDKNALYMITKYTVYDLIVSGNIMNGTVGGGTYDLLFESVGRCMFNNNNVYGNGRTSRVFHSGIDGIIDGNIFKNTGFSNGMATVTVGTNDF